MPATGKETALVTGASGFVGSAVVRALLARGWRVRVLLRPSSDQRNLEGLAVEPAWGSLGERSALDAALAGCRALFHVAADYRLWVRDPAVMYRANVDGTRMVMEAALAAGTKRIVYTSSVATLRLDKGVAAADETHWAALGDMIGPYKRSKFLAEAEVLRMVAAGLPAVIVNPSTPIGPGDVRPTPTGRMILEAARGHMPAYVDTGLNLVHVDDVGEGHVLAFEHGRIGERYILGGENFSLAEILVEIARLNGSSPPRLRLPRLAVLPVALVAEMWGRVTGIEPFVTLDGLRMAAKRMYFSSAKAIRELGYYPRPPQEGLAEALAWFRRQGWLP